MDWACPRFFRPPAPSLFLFPHQKNTGLPQDRLPIMRSIGKLPMASWVPIVIWKMHLFTSQMFVRISVTIQMYFSVQRKFMGLRNCEISAKSHWRAFKAAHFTKSTGFKGSATAILGIITFAVVGLFSSPAHNDFSPYVISPKHEYQQKYIFFKTNSKDVYAKICHWYVVYISRFLFTLAYETGNFFYMMPMKT